MINNYKTMSTLYIKQNKKRTLLTLIGIILSISLISIILLFMKGTEKAQIESTKEATGCSFHLGYKTYTDEILTKVSNNPNVERYGIVSRDNRIDYEDIYIDRYYLDKGATEILKYSLKEGRMPENNNEICIEDWAKPNIKGDLDIGKEIVIDEKQYKIVGILKNESYSQESKTIRLITFSENPQNGELLVEINSKANFDETIETLSSLTSEDNLIRNNELINSIRRGSKKPILIIICIVIAIVVSATIIVIYNSFQINVAERMKQFGLLRSIGATKRQIKAIVFREATILLIIAIPIGMLLSISVIYSIDVIFKLLLKGANTISIVSIDIGVLAISTLITILAVYISSLAPANYVGNISPLIAINSQVVIKKEVIKRRKNRLLKKLFKYKILIVVKNVRRNPGRCRIMILSIIVSSMLFITFTSLMEDAFKLTYTDVENINMDLEVTLNNENYDEQAYYDLIEQINKVDNVDNVYIKYQSIYGMSEISSDKKVKEAGNISKKEKFGEVSKEVIDTDIKAYDKLALDTSEKYLTSGSIDINNMNLENGVILISDGVNRDYENEQHYIGKLTNYKVGDEIVIHNEDKEYKVKVMAIMKSDVLEREIQKNRITLITTEQVLEKIIGTKTQINSIGISLKDDSIHLKTASEVNTILQNYPRSNLTNFVDINQQNKNNKIMIQVLVYGFISVITLISSINIINTISMNITVRRKEIAMLKSIGMSQKDLKRMIMYEGLFYGLFGGISGALIGCGFSYIIYKAILGIVGIQWKVPLRLSVITILASIIISYLSTLLPMRKIQRNNIIEVIREE